MGIFVGYPSNYKGYLIYYPQSKKFAVSRNVIFYEQKLLERRLQLNFGNDDDNHINEVKEWENGN